MKKSSFILSILLGLNYANAQQDPSPDIWENNGSSVEANVPSGGQVRIGVASTWVERPLRVTANDDAASYFEILNGTNQAGRFQPTLRGHYGTHYSPTGGGAGLFLYSSINPNFDLANSTTTMMSFDVRSTNNAVFSTTDGAVQNVDLFRWRNLGTVLMLMDADGNLGINNANPTARLHTNGSVRFENLPSGTGSNVLVTDGSGNVFKTSASGLANDHDWYLSLNGATTSSFPTSNSDDIYTLGRVGIGGPASITETPIGATNPVNITLSVYGNAWASGGNWTTSDRRYKQNIKQIDETVNTVLQNLTGFSYEFVPSDDIKLPKGTQYGLMAQDIEEVLPEAVMDIKASGKDIKAINYQMIIPFLVEGYKQQQKRIESQDVQLKIMQNELEKIKTQLSSTTSSSLSKSNFDISTISIYPNPGSGLLNIDLASFSYDEGLILRIYSIEGKLLVNQPIESQSLITLDLRNESKGYYTAVLFKDASVIASQKFIIE